MTTATCQQQEHVNSKNMPTAVREALVAALTVRLGEGKGEEFVANMESSGKYQTETWS